MSCLDKEIVLNRYNLDRINVNRWNSTTRPPTLFVKIEICNRDTIPHCMHCICYIYLWYSICIIFLVYTCTLNIWAVWFLVMNITILSIHGKIWFNSVLGWFGCLEFSSHSRIFHSFGDVAIAGEGLQILNYARQWGFFSVPYLLGHETSVYD